MILNRRAPRRADQEPVTKAPELQRSRANRSPQPVSITCRATSSASFISVTNEATAPTGAGGPPPPAGLSDSPCGIGIALIDPRLAGPLSRRRVVPPTPLQKISRRFSASRITHPQVPRRPYGSTPIGSITPAAHRSAGPTHQPVPGGRPPNLISRRSSGRRHGQASDLRTRFSGPSEPPRFTRVLTFACGPSHLHQDTRVQAVGAPFSGPRRRAAACTRPGLRGAQRARPLASRQRPVLITVGATTPRHALRWGRYCDLQREGPTWITGSSSRTCGAEQIVSAEASAGRCRSTRR